MDVHTERDSVTMSFRAWLQHVLRHGGDERLDEWFVGVEEVRLVGALSTKECMCGGFPGCCSFQKSRRRRSWKLLDVALRVGWR
jgi:hypothetical protein